LNPVGLSRPVKKLAQEKLPDLSNFQDISEFIDNGGAYFSESEAEFDGPDNEVTIRQELKDNLSQSHSTSAVRLTEIGPRLKLRLLKIQEGVCDGEVLYHSSIKKTTEELKAIQEALKLKK
jgi:ribosome biogenesis protein SSF1/2